MQSVEHDKVGVDDFDTAKYSHNSIAATILSSDKPLCSTYFCLSQIVIRREKWNLL